MDQISRKDFIFKGLVTGAALAGAGAILSQCGKKEEKPAAAAASCNDTSTLSAEDKQQRTNLQYVEKSADPAKKCSTCALFIAPAAGAACGGCNLVKGTINPEGYCTSWVTKG